MAISVSDYVLKRFWQKDPQHRPRFHVFYSKDQISEFYLRYVDAQGEVSTLRIHNTNGTLRTVVKGNSLEFDNWTGLKKYWTKHHGLYISKDDLIYI